MYAFHECALGVTDIKLEHLFLAIMVVNLKINQNPKWVEALRSTTEGLAVEEYIPIFEERMVDVLEIDLGKFDTKVKLGSCTGGIMQISP